MSLQLQKAFGRRVRDLRKAQGFSQESFADHCLVHRTYMGNVERGAINISFQNIVKISAGLKISLSKLLDGLETMPTEDKKTSFLSPVVKKGPAKAGPRRA